MANHPMQPVLIDKFGRPAFKPNAIVEHLLENGATDLNKLAVMRLPKADREQFAQLIGYSVNGFGELSYVSYKAYAKAYELGTAALENGAGPQDHPRQPLVRKRGSIRFKENRVISALFANARVHYGDLKKFGFAAAEWEQFAQLLGHDTETFAREAFASREAIADMQAAISKLCLEAGVDPYDGSAIAP